MHPYDGVTVRITSSNPDAARVAPDGATFGTPIIDIKPYLPYSDRVADATGGFAPQAPDATLEVAFSVQADASLTSAAAPAGLRQLIIEVLSLDPRPAYRRGDEPERVYGVLLAGHNIRWRVVDGGVEVLEIAPGEPR